MKFLLTSAGLFKDLFRLNREMFMQLLISLDSTLMLF